MGKDLVFLARADFSSLIDILQGAGYRTIGPLQRDGAIVYGPLDNIEQLPQTLQDQQSPGQYRLEQIDSPRWFAWANGPQALKPLLFKPSEFMPFGKAFPPLLTALT